MPAVQVEEWTVQHPRWREVAMLIEQLEQTDWVAFEADWHLSSHMLVATTPERVVGVLRYVVQELGVEEDWLPVTLHGTVLTEGKVIAFGVAPAARRQGIGRALQQRLIDDCRAHGCFQIRSHSNQTNIENYRLKLTMGFTMHPLVPGRGKDGAYFLLPLTR